MDKLLKVSLEWCEKHPGWKRICDVEDSSAFYKTWADLTEKEKKRWEKEYRSDAESAWEEWGNKPCKVPYGFVNTEGEFFKNITDIIPLRDFMQVYKVN